MHLAASRTSAPPAEPRAPLAAGQLTIETLCFQSTTTLVSSGNALFSFTLPPGFTPSGNNIYLAVYANGAWQDDFAGPATVGNGGLNVYVREVASAFEPGR